MSRQRINYVGPVEHIPALYEPETATQLIEKDYTISIQEQKTRWFEDSLWSVFVSIEGEVISPQTNLTRDCLNAVLDSLERVAGCR